MQNIVKESRGFCSVLAAENQPLRFFFLFVTKLFLVQTQKNAKLILSGRKLRSSGYMRRLMFQRSWVRILATQNGWTWHFFTLICCKNCIVCLKRPKKVVLWSIRWSICINSIHNFNFWNLPLGRFHENQMWTIVNQSRGDRLSLVQNSHNLLWNPVGLRWIIKFGIFRKAAMQFQA